MHHGSSASSSIILQAKVDFRIEQRWTGHLPQHRHQHRLKGKANRVCLWRGCQVERKVCACVHGSCCR